MCTLEDAFSQNQLQYYTIIVNDSTIYGYYMQV